jgi:hypothetical protein
MKIRRVIIPLGLALAVIAITAAQALASVLPSYLHN